MLSLPDFKQQQILLAFLNKGEKLSFKNDNIVIKDSDGGIKHQSTCYRLFTLIVIGNCSISSGLLQRANKFKFNLIFLGYNLNSYARFNVSADGNVSLRKKQYTYDKLDIAKHLVCNKIAQQKATLSNIRKQTDRNKKAQSNLAIYEENCGNKALDLHGLLGLEGIASRVYFNVLFEEYNWKGRRPRSKQDMTNTLLDIGYTLLFNFIESLLNQYGFDLYKGVYHQFFYQRKSLVCDLVEPFRPIIDSRIRKAYRLGQIHECDFKLENNQYRIFGESAKPYMTFLLTEILKYKEPIFIYILNYYRAFMRNKEISNYPSFNKFDLKC